MRHGTLAFLLALPLAVPAMAADIGPVPDYPPPKHALYSPTPVHDWSGLYAGLQGGYFAGSGHHSSDDPISDTDFNLNGLFGGVVGGANFQSGQWVYGIEGDVNVAGLSADFTVLGNDFEVDSNVVFTLRGRAGVAFDRWLVFATAGLAGASVKFNDVGFGTDSGHMLGFTIGGGAEVWLHDRVSLRGDLLYFDLGSRTFEAGDADDIVSLTGVMARAAVNVAF